jgi:hypothetical protein
MQPFVGSLPALAVSAIYCIWTVYYRHQLRRRTLCERVAYMLWVMAQRVRD